MAVGKIKKVSMTEPAVPSITLAITSDDAKRVAEASKAMQESLSRLQKRSTEPPSEAAKLSDKPSENGQASVPDQGSNPLPSSSSDSAASSTDVIPKKGERKAANRPLHEMIFEAATNCNHPLLATFMERMKSTGATPLELRAGVLLFHQMELPSKIRLIFDVLGKEQNGRDSSSSDKENCQRSLTRKGSVSFFRSIVSSISACIHREPKVQIEMAPNTDPVERPMKKAKPDHHSPNSESAKSQDTSNGGSVPTLQSPSPSFDLSSVKEEEDATACALRKEFEEIANYATDRLMNFASAANGNKMISCVSVDTFFEWNRAEGYEIVPWMELLHLSKWQTPTRSTAKPLVLPGDNTQKTIKSATSLEEKSVKQEDSPPRLDPPSPSFYGNDETSRTVVSFDFTGSMPEADASEVFCINITEENLRTLRNLVRTTGLSTRSCEEISDILLGHSKADIVDGEEVKIMPIERFHTCLKDILGVLPSNRLSKTETDIFSSCLVDFFSCFDRKKVALTSGEADGKELSVGFCFFCAGNKSSKLAAGFELLESEKSAGLTSDQLAQYLRSYLTMLVGISLLTSSPSGIMKPKLSSARRKAMFAAIDHGARWTLGHFLKSEGPSDLPVATLEKKHSFEEFANWYTKGGFNIAPWLELLDLSKLLSLLGEGDFSRKSPALPQDSLPPFPSSTASTPKYYSPRRLRHATPTDSFSQTRKAAPAVEVLFTFPLANHHSLVVLREDATYVRGVVEQLGLLSRTPDDVWTSLYNIALKKPPLAPYHGSKTHSRTNLSKSMMVNKAMFVDCMYATISSVSSSKKRSFTGGLKVDSGAREILANLFHSFDLHQIDRVALNELMGGLTLLCGGKKSTKLAFAFGVFDHRIHPKPKKGKKAPQIVNSLGGEDLFLFLRSFLIVMFSCCRQSWDLSDDAVGRYIADTANMVTDDVMRYQWRARKRDRVDFDEFGEWYNEGGFEMAPWLELLDLKKWVHVDNSENLSLSRSPGLSPDLASGILNSSRSPRSDYACPPPPPDDAVDGSFFNDDDNAIMPMDSIDEMDIILMQQPSQDKENDIASLNKLARTFSYSPRQTRPTPRGLNSLKFHLVTDDEHGGYLVSISQKRILHLRHLLMESGLHKFDCETACKQILGKSRSSRQGSYHLTKDDFDSAMRGVLVHSNMCVETQRSLSELFAGIFSAFDRERKGAANALEVACGFTVLCHGKKSDKLEYAFEVLDREKRGNLSKSDTARYLRSFLTVLLSISFTNALENDRHDDTMTTMNGDEFDRSSSNMLRVVEAGSSWAASQAFKNRRNGRDYICFDEFAEWYTHVGYGNIPWLELLDLHKWVVMDT